MSLLRYSLTFIFTLSLLSWLVPQIGAPAYGYTNLGLPPDFQPEGLTSRGVYDFITAANEGRSIGEMVLDIEEAPQRAYDMLEYAVYTAAYAIRPQDDELTAFRKVDSILFEHMGFRRGLPGTTFSDGLMNGILDCSDASLVFISAAKRSGHKWFTLLAPFHMFVGAKEGSGSIFWETQAGTTLDVADMIAFHGIRQELIDNDVYLQELTVRHHIAEAYRNIGGILARRGDLDLAKVYLDKSEWLWPSHPPTLIWRGYVHALKGEYNLAETDYRSALSTDNQDWVAWYHLAALYKEIGRTSEAIRYAELSEQYRPANAQWVIEEALPYLNSKE